MELISHNVIEMEENTVEFVAVTTKYIPEYKLLNLFRWADKQPIIFRHKHPAKKTGGTILGRSVTTRIVEMDDGEKALVVNGQIDGHSPSQQKARELITSAQTTKTPMMISIGYEDIEDESGEYKDSQIYEYSITPTPVCKECNFIGMSDMPTDNITELESHKTKIDELMGSIGGYKSKITELEEDKAKLLTKVTEMETKYLKTKDDMSTLQTSVVELENKIQIMDKQPIVDAIYNLEKDKTLLEIYKTKDKPWLNTRLEEVKVRYTNAPIATQAITEMEDQIDLDAIVANASETSKESIRFLVKGGKT